MTKKISVHIRLRNNVQREKCPWTIKENILYQKMNKEEHLSFPNYQSVYFQENTEFIYNDCIKPIVQDFSRGTNCTIFAYGQTGSGKTYTMFGNNEYPGIITLSLEDILSKNINRDIKVSYLEIYNEKLYDLINPDVKIKIYTMNNVLIVSNLTKVSVNTLDQALDIIKTSEKRRRIGQTEFNERSSRSHTIFQVYLHNETETNTLSLIDLAGSERAAGSSERRKEGSYINKSLLALGTVINSLAKNSFASFRDSKLTRFLQQSMDGNSSVISICMISPIKECLDESISTLNFASRLSKIELKNKQTRMVKITEPEIKEEMCCKCKNKLSGEYIKASTEQENNNKIEGNPFIKERELFKNRINTLEQMINSLLDLNPSKRTSEIYVLEKSMFELQYEMLKRKNYKD